MNSVFGTFNLDVPGSWIVIAADQHRDKDLRVELPAIIREVDSCGETHFVIWPKDPDDLCKLCDLCNRCDGLGIWSITRTDDEDGQVAIMRPTEVERE